MEPPKAHYYVCAYIVPAAGDMGHVSVCMSRRVRDASAVDFIRAHIQNIIQFIYPVCILYMRQINI